MTPEDRYNALLDAGPDLLPELNRHLAEAAEHTEPESLEDVLAKYSCLRRMVIYAALQGQKK